MPAHSGGNLALAIATKGRTVTDISYLSGIGEALGRLTREVSAGLAECARTCSFWEISGGGSPVNRLAEHGFLAVAETQFCRLTVQATARALQRLLRSTGELRLPHNPDVDQNAKEGVPRTGRKPTT